MWSAMQEHAITSDEALALPDLPRGPIVVVGAGYISLEFAGIYNGMGKDVHLFYRKALPLVGYASFSLYLLIWDLLTAP